MGGTLLVLVAGVALAAAPAGRSGWNAARSELEQALRTYRDLSRLARDDARVTGAVERVDAALAAALAPGDDPPLIRRIEEVLPEVEGYAPEHHPDLHEAFSARFRAAAVALEDDDLDELAALAKKLWGGRGGRSAERTAIQRMLLARTLGPLLEKNRQKKYLAGLVIALLGSEIESIRPVAPKPLTLAKAIEALGTQPESPTVYPLLDALETAYGFAFAEGRPGDILEPAVTQLIECLRRIEVRARGERRNEVLDIEDVRAPSQFRLWFRVADILQRWTGETDPVWHEEWVRFWKLYHGKDRVQGDFDFLAARNRQLGVVEEGVGTRRARTQKRARFFGIEHQSAKFLIVLDVSGSMEENADGLDRLDGLKREAIRFIASLKPGVHYNILTFASDCEIGRSLSGGHRLVPKTLPAGEISEATTRWITSLRSGGLTRVDLAFREAFGAAPNDPSRPVAGGRFRPEFREIYFITDGSPTDEKGRALDGGAVKALLTRIRSLNSRHGAIIHSIGFPRMASYFIRELAAQNGGTLKIIRDEDMRPSATGGAAETGEPEPPGKSSFPAGARGL